MVHGLDLRKHKKKHQKTYQTGHNQQTDKVSYI